MISTPTGWSRRYHAGSVLLFPPRGPTRGGIRYVEHLAPLAPVRQLVEQLLSDPVLSVDTVGSIERLTTVEGEHAALVTIRGSLDGQPAQRDVGFVLLDHHYARVDGLALCADDFAASTAIVRALICGDVHLAGERQRRFEYESPAGWHARARGLHADWYPLDFPRSRGVIHVFPALPAARVGMASGLLTLLGDEEVAAGWLEDAREAPLAISSDHGLTGVETSCVGRFPDRPRSWRALAVFEEIRLVREHLL